MKILLLTVLCAVSIARAEEAALGTYKIDDQGVTASGVSAGAFMAVQMEVAYSRTVVGAGSVAGGIYGCAEGSVQTAQVNCMALPGALRPEKYVARAKALAAEDRIDPLENLARHRVFIFAGTKDSVIVPVGSVKLKEFYDGLMMPENIRFENGITAVHGFPTRDYGNPCNVQTTPWILNCGYDGAGEILRAMYGELNPKAVAIDENLHRFSQAEFAEPEAGLFSGGWVYVPSACERGETCRLHLALHGCLMNPEDIQDRFVRHAGYNGWAEANHIIVLYPQVAKARGLNPYGCWDWWGYTGESYATRSGLQMTALKKMIDRVRGRDVRVRSERRGAMGPCFVPQAPPERTRRPETRAS